MRQVIRNEEGTEPGWGLSVASWLCLFLAVGLYAAVALAPRLSDYFDLRRRYRANQDRLVALQQEVDSLESVARALDEDREFAEELARYEFQTAPSGEERIAVPPDLAMHPRAVRSFSGRREPGPGEATAFERGHWPGSLVEPLAHDPTTRGAALAVAGVLLLLGFVTFGEGAPGESGSGGSPLVSGLRRLVGRYRQGSAPAKPR